MPDSTSLFRTRRFLPIFLTQFLGALNDNIFKNALVVLITYDLVFAGKANPEFLVTVAAGLFILPFFLFSAFAGQLADKFEKAMLIRHIKLAEIMIMLLAVFGFYLHNVWFQLVILFLLGAQSAFFGPLKYSILPDHLQERELTAGNGYVEASTFLAILIGTVVGGLLIRVEPYGTWVVSGIIVIVALLGYIFARAVPPALPSGVDVKMRFSFGTETFRLLKTTYAMRDVFSVLIGISWFWFVGAIFLAQFPTLASKELHGNEQVITLFLTLFSFGIAIGSLICNWISKGKVKSILVPVGAVGMSIFMFDFIVAIRGIELPSTQELLDVAGFFAVYQSTAWRIVSDLFFTAVFGGLYIVPLYVLMQTRSPTEMRARVVASNNILNALFMVVSALVTLLLLGIGLKVTDILLITAAANGAVAVAGYFTLRKKPE